MLSVVVPAYNEEQRLPRTLETMRAFLDARGEEYEVIAVDDGSHDGTLALLTSAATAWPQLTVLPLGHNQGKGAAVRAGMLKSRGELRLFMDADLSTPMEELDALRSRIGERCQVAIASRALPGTRIGVNQPWRRVVMGKTYNRMLRVVALPGIHDSQCGFKLFTAEAAVRCFTPLQTPRFGFDAEVLLRARRLGYAVAEVPVQWSHMEDSRVSALRDSLQTLTDLLLLRVRLRTRRGRSRTHQGPPS